MRFAQSYILGRLRNVTFFSLAECNAAIAAAVERMNSREMRRLGMSRRQLFEAIERPVMQVLPDHDFEYRRVASRPRRHRLSCRDPGLLLLRTARPAPRAGGHASNGPHDRGVPPRPPGRRTRAALWWAASRHSARTHAERAPALCGVDPGAAPARCPRHWAEHRGIDHRRDEAGWPHPEQGFRTCLGVLRLFRSLDAARVEAVCLRAVEIGALSYASIASILKHRLDQSASPQAADGTPLLHENIRGSGYFH